MSNDFGDFEEVVDDSAKKPSIEGSPEEAPTRVRTPRKGEVIGIIRQRLGGNRMEVQCTDGKTRNCRVPGRYKRSLWLRPNDIVMVEPWEHDDDKGDVVYKYNPGAANQLRKRGLLDSLSTEF